MSVALWATVNASFTALSIAYEWHAVSMKGRQRRDRSDLSERPAGTAGRAVHAACAYSGPQPWHSGHSMGAWQPGHRMPAKGLKGAHAGGKLQGT